MAFKQQPKGFATKAIHAGQEPDQWNSQCVIPPIVTSSIYKLDSVEDIKGFTYSRAGNPTREVLERCLAALDNAKYGLAFSSGLGAITAVLTMFSSGDHVIIGDDVYGGTSRLMCQVMRRLGFEYSFADTTDMKEMSAAIKANTKLVLIESPTNPLMKVADIEAISKETRKHDIIFAVDNTFLTPYFQRPLEIGADIAIYSASKYLNGHSDLIMGAVTVNDDKLYERLKFLQKAAGSVPSPFDCYQLNRSLKTLPLRMNKCQENAIAVAKFLESHPLIEKVLHPALPSHPQHKTALKQTYGCSSVFSLYLKGNLEVTLTFLKSLKLFTLAGSLGNINSTAEVPSLMSHASISVAKRLQLGITDTLIRFSVGLEDKEDLIEDLKQALATIRSS